ncbi:MAG: multidrug resistance protein, partial [Parcubacteria group bacterium]|nr:multidrug resistance protein [Parcubacteria group bacterium]
HTTIKLLFVAFGVMCLQSITSWIDGFVMVNRFDLDSSTHIRNLTLKQLLSLSIGQHRNEHSGLTQSVINEGQSGVGNILNLTVYQLIPEVVRIVVGLVALFFFSWQIGFIAFVGVMILLIIIYFTNSYFLPFIKHERKVGQDNDKKRMEMIRNAPLVISNAGEEYVQSTLDEDMQIHNMYSKKLWNKYFIISYLIRPFIQNLALIGCIGVAAYLVAQGQLSAGQIITIILWTNIVLTNLGTLGHLQRQLLINGERARKYFGLLDLTSDVVIHGKQIKPETISGQISFEDVSFVYPKGRIIEDDKKEDSEEVVKASKEALQNISFSIKAGEHVAFVGSSGAGKSTATLLLLRGSDPQSGSIKIDGIDLREIDLGFYRQHVGIVEQNIVLFDDTLRQNISFGLPGGQLLSDEKLDELAKIARIDEFKDKLTKGWDTMLGENGIKLSGGQRQRVGIARALAKDPAILILDEATSSLDAKNEALIKDALHEASVGRTTIMVAHRLSTVKDADRIFVFDKGTIVGVGKHEELLKSTPIYADLVSHQTVLV